MAMLVPRLRLTEATAMRLRTKAEEDGVPIGQAIARILEERLATGGTESETLFRLILVAERFGLSVGGTATYPSVWESVGKLTRDECHDIAMAYLAWKRRLTEAVNNGKGVSTSGSPLTTVTRRDRLAGGR